MLALPQDCRGGVAGSVRVAAAGGAGAGTAAGTGKGWAWASVAPGSSTGVGAGGYTGNVVGMGLPSATLWMRRCYAITLLM